MKYSSWNTALRTLVSVVGGCESAVTKYRYGTSAGLAAASREARPGAAIGPGGSPAYRYVLYGESNARSVRRRLPS
jgi:hypothetical protein